MPVVSFGHKRIDRDFRTLDVRTDDTDARDYIFEPSLILLPYEKQPPRGIPVLDQGQEGACVGFALATVINVSILQRIETQALRTGGTKKFDQVSARMLYEIAKRYDEWKGKHYDGTSPRGAIKGWHHHGVASERAWSSKGRRTKNNLWVVDRAFTVEREEEAKKRPIGAYYRVIDSDVSHLQAALVEGDAVLASAWVHNGWDARILSSHRGKGYPVIPFRQRAKGLHAFAIVGYTPGGFIIQNSWGRNWGKGGLALLHYDDWMEHRQDAWVSRPGPETRDHKGRPAIFVVGFAGFPAGTEKDAHIRSSGDGLGLHNPEVLSYLINTDDKGTLSTRGALTTSREQLPGMAQRVLATPVLSDGCHHVVLYAHGGLNSETSAVSVADRLWGAARSQGLCPYFFIWESSWDESLFGYFKSEDDQTGPAGFSFGDAWKKLKEKLGEAIEGGQKWMGEKLAPTARTVFWNEMKGRCAGASQSKGGATLFLNELFAVIRTTPKERYKVHLVGHSAGSIFHGFLYERALRRGIQDLSNVELASIHFLAPAITVGRASQAFIPGGTRAVPSNRFFVHTLASQAEDSDSITIYPSSLLTYVADHLESASGRIPVLGIRKDFLAAPVTFATGVLATQSRRHGEFDDRGHEIDGVLKAIGRATY
jgi:hypothetical protein